jgi:hypothetical protein
MAARRLSWWSVAAGSAATIAAGLPMLIAAGLLALRRPDVISDGDAAVDEMALMRAQHFAQLVGNYSRFGWNHLGPGWFYAIDTVYLPLGRNSWAFFVAVLTLQALAACLIVATAWRIRGPALAAITAVLLLWFIAKLGLSIFRDPWPPYATILPMILFLLLVALGSAGSMLAMVGALIVGSYEAQLHVGTVPMVMIGLGTMVLLRVFGQRLTGHTRFAGTSRQRVGASSLLALGLIVLIVMWVPVAVDEITGQPGNLTKLAQFFFFAHNVHHPLHEGISALGRHLVVFPFGHSPPQLESDFSTLPMRRLLAVLGFLALSGALAAAGTALRDRFAQSLGIVLVITTLGLSWSISRVVGDLYSYFLLWTTTLTLILIVGWAELAIASSPWKWLPASLESITVKALIGGMASAVVVLTSVRAIGFADLASPASEFDPGTRTAATLVEHTLASEQRQPVLVTINTIDRWPTAAGVSLQLMKRGWSVYFNQDYVFMFGEQSLASGHERLELLFVAASNVNEFEQHAHGIRLVGIAGDTYVFLRALPNAGAA